MSASTASNTEMSSRIPSHFTVEKHCVICHTTTQAVIDPDIFAKARIHLHFFHVKFTIDMGEWKQD
jgi:hypothetical protein